jgi:hypothetical protein
MDIQETISTVTTPPTIITSHAIVADDCCRHSLGTDTQQSFPGLNLSLCLDTNHTLQRFHAATKTD